MTDDLWLDKHENILEASRHLPILDLGCGTGYDSLYLTVRGYRVIGCDISEEKIAALKAAVPKADGMVVDMRQGLPFGNESFFAVIADLSLHYFKWEDTVRIVRDIGRVLKDGGVLLCRLNSTKDINYGAGQGERIEENFFSMNGMTKRFFDLKQVQALFSDWEILDVGESQMGRFKLPKLLWEVAVRKKA